MDSGSAATVRDRIFHWDGSSWTLYTAAPDVTQLFGLWGFSASDIWATGGVATGAPGTTILLHWDGVSWTSQTGSLPRTDFAGFNLWGPAAGDVWLSAQGPNRLTLHLSGGVWTEYAFTDFVADGIMGSSPTELWAIGANTAATEGKVLHMDSGGVFAEMSTTSPTGKFFTGYVFNNENVWITDGDGVIERESCVCAFEPTPNTSAAEAVIPLMIIVGLSSGVVVLIIGFITKHRIMGVTGLTIAGTLWLSAGIPSVQAQVARCAAANQNLMDTLTLAIITIALGGAFAVMSAAAVIVGTKGGDPMKVFKAGFQGTKEIMKDARHGKNPFRESPAPKGPMGAKIPYHKFRTGYVKMKSLFKKDT